MSGLENFNAGDVISIPDSERAFSLVELPPASNIRLLPQTTLHSERNDPIGHASFLAVVFPPVRTSVAASDNTQDVDTQVNHSLAQSLSLSRHDGPSPLSNASHGFRYSPLA